MANLFQVPKTHFTMGSQFYLLITIIINCRWVYTQWQYATMQNWTIHYSTVQ